MNRRLYSHICTFITASFGMVSLTCLGLMCSGCSLPSENHAAPGDILFKMPSEKIQTRWFTYENPEGMKGAGGQARFGRKGAPAVVIPAGRSITLLDVQGSGTVRRIWCTLHNMGERALRGLKIEMYWDDAVTPAVQAPIGDFMCHSLGRMCAFENALFSSPEGRSFNCIIPMPFKKHARVVLINESDQDNGIYYEIDCTLGEDHNDDMLYFHSYWRRENPTVVRRDMVILPGIEGKGKFLGCNLGIRLAECCRNFWWGEGEVKIYLDGDSDYPTLCGTGTEDYIGTGYGQGHFNHLYQGNQFIGPKKNPKDEFGMAYGFYRFHIPDSIYFYEDIRVTIQVMGGPSYQKMIEAMEKNPGLRFMKAGESGKYYSMEELKANPQNAEVMERVDDYTATAYWYMDRPENNLGPIAGFQARVADLSFSE